MLDIMSQAQNAIAAYNSALSVHSSNIANMDVIGYKRLDISFQSIFEKVLRQGTAANTFANLGGTNPEQFGQGTAVSNVSVDFTAGGTVEGSKIDLAIQGQGLFVVSPDGGNSYLYTRAGKFSIVNGNLVTEAGMQVYGLNDSGGLTAITGLTGDSTLYNWSTSGELLYNSARTGYRIALTYFPNPGGLQQAQGTTFRETMASGSAATPEAPEGTAGSIIPERTEQSNVFYIGENIDALEIQRAMSANLSVVRMASDIISSFISKLG
jgi:flagellar hook protein FlgE